MRRFLLAGLLLLWCSPAFAAGVPATGCGSSNNWIVGSGAQIDSVGDGCVAGPVTTVSTSATTAATITLTPATGQFVHVVAITVDNCAGASPVAAANPTSITTTNLGITIMVGSGLSAGTCQQISQSMLGNDPVRATASGASTIVLPTFATNQTIRVSVYWFSAP